MSATLPVLIRGLELREDALFAVISAGATKHETLLLRVGDVDKTGTVYTRESLVDVVRMWNEVGRK